MRRKMVKCDAPSTSAASLSSFGHLAEEAVQDEHLIGHAESEIRQDDADLGVDEPERVDQREQRREHHLERQHCSEQDEEKDRASRRQLDAAQRIGRHRRDEEAERDLDDRDDGAVEHRRAEMPAGPRARVVAPFEARRRRERARPHHRRIGLERREDDEHEWRDPDDRKHDQRHPQDHQNRVDAIEAGRPERASKAVHGPASRCVRDHLR